MARREQKYKEWEELRSLDFELDGNRREYWLKARELPALAFRQCVCNLLVNKCKYNTVVVGRFLELDHSTVLNCLEKYEQCRNHPEMKHFYNRIENKAKMDLVQTRFEEFLFQDYIESGKPILSTVKHMVYMGLKKVRSINKNNKYRAIITAMANLNDEFLKVIKEEKNEN